MEVIAANRHVAVTESSQPVEARYVARELAEAAGFGETDVHRVGLVATELATNLVKHARGGELLARVRHTPPHAEVELIALDRGPGMRDLKQSFADGHSTAGSPGTGLGAIRRLADDFDLYTQPDRGTAIVARLRAGRAPRADTHPLDVSGISVAKSGETVCGDAWDVRHETDGAVLLLADGLGHGLSAAEAAGAAVVAFQARRFPAVADMLHAVHDQLRSTRGAAGAIAEISATRHVVNYVAVGNISTAIVHNGTIRQAVSHNGTLGHEARYFREYSYPCPAEALVVMHSDGLGTHWSLDAYPGIRQRDPALVAAVLYRDFSRQRDDVTVLVVRRPRP